MNIFDFIACDSYVTTNKYLLKALGANAALMLCELASEFKYWLTRGLAQDGWFYSTVENIESELGFNDYVQRATLRALQKRGLLEVRVQGLPPKRYIKLNAKNIVNLINEEIEKENQKKSEKWHSDQFFKNLRIDPENLNEFAKNRIPTNSLNFKELNLEIFKNRLSYINKNNINKNNILERDENRAEKTSPVDTKPTSPKTANKRPSNLEEVQTYFQEANLKTNPIAFYWFYEGKEWHGIKDWHKVAKAWTDIGYNQNRKKHKNKYQENNIYNSLSSEDLDKL